MKGTSMKKIFLVAVLFISACCSEGHALAVFDGSNLAQNIVSAQEAIRHTQNQIQTITNQINQYKRMLQDAMNPGSWEWGDIEDALDQLTNSMDSLDSFGGAAGGLNGFLDSFGSHSKYHESGEYYGRGNPALYSGDLAGMDMQKQSADDMFTLITEQQEAMRTYAADLEQLKSAASSAQGQQEAIQAGNEFASMEIQLLSQIHTLLLAQNTMLAAQLETATNRKAQQRMGTAIKMGETDFTRNEAARGGKSYRPF
ncbi:MAG: P-type conjugative transfer protein TrbJ [Planctomycetota bacterium]|jgi:P-type conjugative transfer protein TrbJ|nr:P-type conjugative transfer protein TrbJ [Planctomycetota bacterium]